MTDRTAFKVVMLCRDDATSRIMYHGLLADWNISQVIIEDKPSTRMMLQRRVQRLGLWTVFGQILFMLYTRLIAVRMAQGVLKALLRDGALNDQPFPPERVTRVPSANDPRVIQLLRELQPDAVVVNGTRILSAAVLASIPAPFINTHVGITPRYRGVHGGYWAMACQDAEHCGVTVHLVDEGIDTGGVLYQGRIDVGPDDSFVTYPLRQIARALPLMSAALRDVKNRCLRTVAGVGPSGIWSHPTLWQYVWHRLSKGVK